MTENTQLAPVNPLVGQLVKDQTVAFIPGMRIAQGQSDILKNKEAKAQLGDIYIMDRVVGERVPVIIGPWRFKALHLKNDKVEVEDYNLSPNSKYENGMWNMQEYTPTFAALNEKAKQKIPYGSPEQFFAGFEVLFYLPNDDLYASFYFAKTALKQDVHKVCMMNQGKSGTLFAKLIETPKFSWYVPALALNLTHPEHTFDPELVQKFLWPGPVSDPNSQADARPR